MTNILLVNKTTYVLDFVKKEKNKRKSNKIYSIRWKSLDKRLVIFDMRIQTVGNWSFCRCTNPFITLNSAITAHKKGTHFINLFGLVLLNTKIQYFVYLLCGLLLVWPQVFQLFSFRPRPLFVIYPYDRQFIFDYKFDSPLILSASRLL